LVLVEGELLNSCLTELAALADVYAALVILHLLLGFKSLLAFNCRALKFVLVVHFQIVCVDCLSRFKSRIPNLASLHKALDTTLVPEVRTAHLLGRDFQGTALGGRTIIVGVGEAHEEYF